MAQQPTTEQRIFILEGKVAELERFRHDQENRDIALLARIDGFIDDLRRVERVQMRSFETVIAGQKDLVVEQRNLAAEQKELDVSVRRLIH